MDGPAAFSPDRTVLCLFDVDGTLTAARQVVRSSEPEEDSLGQLFTIKL